MRRVGFCILVAAPTLFAWSWAASGDRLGAASPDKEKLGEESRPSVAPGEASSPVYLDGESIVADDRAEYSHNDRYSHNEQRAQHPQPTPRRVWADAPQEMAAEALRLRDARGSIVPDDFGNIAAPQSRPARARHGVRDRGSWSPERPQLQEQWGQVASPDRRERGTPSAIGVLRESAIGLDSVANRLEGFELYDEADSLRAEAQKMRVKARTLCGPSSGTIESREPLEPTPISADDVVPQGPAR